MRTPLIVALSILLTSGIAIAQSGGPYTITHSVIANGGGRSGDATFLIEGTIGQYAAGSILSQPPYSSQAGFWQSFLSPTAAAVSLSGRVITAKGTPVPGSRVILINAQGGSARTALTNGFGYFQLGGVEAGQSYLLDVRKYGFQFEPRVVSEH
jgi:hypothetical protein